MTLASNPRRLGAEIGVVAVLHTWGQTLTHHPHVHCVVPGGGLSSDGARWIAGRPNFFLAVKPLSRLFRRLFLERLKAAFDAGDLGFFGDLAHLAEPTAFATHLTAMRHVDWIVYAKKPFGGPAKVLAYLGRYTHRVAIANSRLVSLDDDHVAFRWKDYRQGGTTKVMKLKACEFIRRFLLHALPDGFHRIRHFGFMANSHRAAKFALCRSLLADYGEQPAPKNVEPASLNSTHQRSTDVPVCLHCGGVMRVVIRFPRRRARRLRRGYRRQLLDGAGVRHVPHRELFRSRRSHPPSRRRGADGCRRNYGAGLHDRPGHRGYVDAGARQRDRLAVDPWWRLFWGEIPRRRLLRRRRPRAVRARLRKRHAAHLP